MEQFVSRVAAMVADALGIAASDVEPLVTPSRDLKRGDLALPCFQLAQRLGRAGKSGAPDLARELAERLSGPPLLGVEAAGPFVNFRLDPAAVAREVLTAAAAPRWGLSDEGHGRAVVIDFSSPNVAKPFHLGHLRSTVIGWSLRQIFRALGYEVVGVNHLGDWGTQFGLMIAAWQRWRPEAEERLAAGEREIDLFYDLYVRINAEARKDPATHEEGRAWFRRLEEGDATARELYRYFVDRSLAEFARIYEILGVSHESQAGEAFYEDKMPAMVERLRASGLLVAGKTRREEAEEAAAQARHKVEAARAERAEAAERLAALPAGDKQRKKLEGQVARLERELPGLEQAAAQAAVAVPASDDGRRPLGVEVPEAPQGFCMLLKDDGGTTYATRDVTAAFYRATTYQPARIIYVVGNEQRDHFLTWFKVVERLGEPWADALVHVGFGKYLGMSTRGGTAVFLEEVLERARQAARAAAEQATKKVELSAEERERVARAIGAGAVKFFDLRQARTKDIDLSLKGAAGEAGIDWDRLLDLKGDTGPYLQFAYARLAGILRRYEGPAGGEVDFSLLAEPEARALIQAIAELPGRVRQAAAEYEPSVIARYVLDLAQKTHGFVHHHRVIDATPDEQQAARGVTPEALRAARVLLVTCAKTTIARAFDLLGIEALEQM